MAYNLKNYIKTLKGFKAIPEEDLFDQIFDQIQKPKKKKRFLLWLLLFPLIGIISFFFPLKESNLPRKSSVINDAKEQLSHEKSTFKTKTIANLALDSQNRTELSNKINKQNKTQNKISNLKEELKIIANDNDSGSNKFITSKSIDHNHIEDNTDNIDNAGSLTLANQYNKTSSIQTDKKKEKTNFTKESNYNENIVTQQRKTITKMDSLQTKTFREDFIIALLSPLPYKEFSIMADYPKLIDTRFPIINSKIKSDRAIEIGAEKSQYQYCKNGIATSVGLNANFVLPLDKKLSLNIGIAHQELKYDFSFDAKMLNAFGNTDKYPAMYFLKERILTISNSMSYQTLQIGLNYHLFSISKFNFELGFSQSLIIHFDQNLSYTLNNSLTYRYQKSSIPFSLGQSRTNLKVFYPIWNGIDLYAKASYGYNFQFIGIEKEKYAGLILGLGMSIRI